MSFNVIDDNNSSHSIQKIRNGLKHLVHHEGYWSYDIFVALSTVVFAYWITLISYRSLFSPLSKIPGPWLAGVTYYYEAFYEVWLGGQYFKRVTQLHRKYGDREGPIVRITPDEVHWNDPSFIDEIYPGPSRKTNKPLWFAERTGTPSSIASIPDHSLHRRRRNALNAYFSIASVRRLEPIMKTFMNKMIKRMEQSGKDEEVVQIHRLFRACASDIITMYAFGECLDYTDKPDYGSSYFQATDWFFRLTHVFGQMPGLVNRVQRMPAWLIRVLAPFLSPLRYRQDWWISRVREIRNSPDPERVKTTIFEGIFNSSLPSEEKTDTRMASEAQLIVFAGEGTTAHSLTCCLYHLLANPNEVRKLKVELNTAIPRVEDLSVAHIDNLPYLGAIIQEAVRLHPGVMARQVRVSPDVPVVYDDPRSQKRYVVPPGTVTSMSPLDTHMHPGAFGDDAYEFRPQRWIEDPKLKGSFMGFSRGARNCIGMTLARREMAMTLASIFLRYDVYQGQKGATLELYDTERTRDIDADSDYIIPVPKMGSMGLRVKIRS
ncbi:cytochrome P450 CYP682H1 [Lentithecium fluviatile CBS 122367]|uniref:Cytochrome P450 CYP682H1 n=1 Tax=Lentithecium fluviatile CBS 122367 TaxID=1168545 RepID=A0A6G1ITI7_9PLEO|nr:cytochrome P450 CYP682H1 [Lentithecium fluviatile CBS 122367]